jgi:hypothetical protein
LNALPIGTTTMESAGRSMARVVACERMNSTVIAAALHQSMRRGGHFSGRQPLPADGAEATLGLPPRGEVRRVIKSGAAGATTAGRFVPLLSSPHLHPSRLAHGEHAVFRSMTSPAAPMPSDAAREPSRAVVLAAPAGGITSSEFGPRSRLLLRSPLSIPWLAGGRESVEIARTGDFSAADSVAPSIAGTVAGNPYPPVQAAFRSAVMASHGTVVMPAPDSRTATVSVATGGSLSVLPKVIQRRTTIIEAGSWCREPAAFTAHRPFAASGGHSGDLASSIIVRNSPRVPTKTAPSAESVSLHRSFERNHGDGRVALAVNGTVARGLATAASSLARLGGTSPRPAFPDAANGFAAGEGVYAFRRYSSEATAPELPLAKAAGHSTAVDAAPPLMLSAAPLAAGEGRSAPAATVDTATHSSSQSGSAPDIDDLVERVTRRLTRQLAIDHERRGAPTWR